MADKTGISWTDATWNPVRGCSIVSSGCTRCYAMKMAHRFSGPGKPYDGLTKMTKGGPVWTGKAIAVPDMLDVPLRWKRPRKIFVNSMSDLFHEDVPFDFIDQVFAVMALATQHTFQVLTKRPERMLEYFWPARKLGGLTRDALVDGVAQKLHHERTGEDPSMWLAVHWPLPNVWLGVSVENQATANERILPLLQTPAAVRFISAEPLLEAVNFRFDWMAEWNAIAVKCDQETAKVNIDWVIVGGESGPGARPFDINWARSIIKQCKAAGVACFVKQIGSAPRNWCKSILNMDGKDRGECDPDHCDNYEASEQSAPCTSAVPRCVYLEDRAGADPAEWPSDLRVQEFPK